MNPILLKALVAFVPVGLLLCGSIVQFKRERTVPAFLQLSGAGFLTVVVLTHVSEALHLFPWMRWGLEGSAGHYLDLSSAVLGLSLFPIGYFGGALRNRPS